MDRVVEVLQETLQRPPTCFDFDQERAVAALAQIPGAVATNLLEQVARNPQRDHAVRATAIVSLYLRAAAGQVATPPALPEHKWLRELVVVRLARKQGQQALPLLVRLLRSDPSLYVRAATAKQIGRLGGPAEVAALVAAIQDKEAIVQADAAAALAELAGRHSCEQAAASALCAILKRGTGPGLRWAAHALELMDYKEAIPTLAQALHEHSDWLLRSKLIETLAALGGQKALPQIVTVLNDPHEHEFVRTQVVELLGTLGDSANVPQVVTALQDRDHRVREAAVVALSKIAGAAAGPHLEGLLDDPHSRVRLAAALALAGLRQKPAKPPR